MFLVKYLGSAEKLNLNNDWF